jgi:hypothetical protein
MFAELIAELRGMLAILPDYGRNPFMLYALVLAIYLIWRRLGKP